MGGSMADFKWDPKIPQTYDSSYGSQTVTVDSCSRQAEADFTVTGGALTLLSQNSSQWPDSPGSVVFNIKGTDYGHGAALRIDGAPLQLGMALINVGPFAVLILNSSAITALGQCTMSVSSGSTVAFGDQTNDASTLSLNFRSLELTDGANVIFSSLKSTIQGQCTLDGSVMQVVNGQFTGEFSLSHGSTITLSGPAGTGDGESVLLEGQFTLTGGSSINTASGSVPNLLVIPGSSFVLDGSSQDFGIQSLDSSVPGSHFDCDVTVSNGSTAIFHAYKYDSSHTNVPVREGMFKFTGGRPGTFRFSGSNANAFLAAAMIAGRFFSVDGVVGAACRWETGTDQSGPYVDIMPS